MPLLVVRHVEEGRGAVQQHVLDDLAVTEPARSSDF